MWQGRLKVRKFSRLIGGAAMLLLMALTGSPALAQKPAPDLPSDIPDKFLPTLDAFEAEFQGVGASA